MTKKEEEYLFQKFVEIYKDLPAGVALFDDKPDVIFKKINGGTIGIELTECIYNEKLMKQSESQIRFNEEVIKRLQDIMPFKFYLDIDLDKRKPIGQKQREASISGLLQFCASEFQDLRQNESKRVEQLDIDWSQVQPPFSQHLRDCGYRKLPTGVSRIRMGRYDVLEESGHSQSKGGVVPDFTDDSLSSILARKNKALIKYKKCDQQWLVICEGLDFYSYYKDVRIQSEIITGVNKVFMYRSFDSEVIVIK